MYEIKYPKHIKEPIRIKIAAEQFQHEFRKLFPSIKQKDWRKIDKDIYNWFDGEASELMPVHDFWNAFEGVLRGFKLKSLLFWITAENICWVEKKVKVRDTILTWAPQLSFMGGSPYRASEIIATLKNPKNKKIKEKLRSDSDKRVKSFVPRDFHKVILINNKGEGLVTEFTEHKSFGGYEILEGNRRVLRVIIYDKEYIDAYVGEFKGKEKRPKNYWVPTGFLRNLVFLANVFLAKGNKKAFNNIKAIYKEILKESEFARNISRYRVFKSSQADIGFKKSLKNYF